MMLELGRMAADKPPAIDEVSLMRASGKQFDFYVIPLFCSIAEMGNSLGCL
jgi:hypothetical protein